MANSSFDINTVLQDAVLVITSPANFYRRMSHSGGYAEPIIFLVVMAVIAGLLLAFLSLFVTGMVGSIAIGLWAVIMFPLFAMVASFIGGGVMFVLWKLMGSDKSFETTYRCVAYAGAIYPITAVLGLIPYFGTLIGVTWGMYLLVMASIEVHGLEAKKAYTVFGVLGILVIMFNLSGEMDARRTQAQLEQMGLTMEEMQNKSPEELGKMVGEFLKGMEKGQSKSE